MDREPILVEKPFPLYAVPRVWGWTKTYRHRIADDFGHQDESAFVNALMEKMGSGLETWAVMRGEELGGLVCAEPITPVVLSCDVLFKPQFFGKDTIDPAMRQVLKELFSRDNVAKVSMNLFDDNSGLISMFTRLGGSIEARLKNHTMRQGRLVNVISIAIQKGDFSCSA